MENHIPPQKRKTTREAGTVLIQTDNQKAYDIINSKNQQFNKVLLLPDFS